MYPPMRSRYFVGVLLFIGITTPAYAYIDPNAGGTLFQLLTPLLAVGAAALTYARKQLGRVWLLLSGAVKNRFDRFFRGVGREID
jgi:lipoprotein signal peptidase